jgi:hypothetical protein
LLCRRAALPLPSRYAHRGWRETGAGACDVSFIYYHGTWRR